jgi:hypothetical protein
MEAPVAEDARSNRSDDQALQLAHEIERILDQMQADLDAAEARLARKRIPIAEPHDPKS